MYPSGVCYGSGIIDYRVREHNDRVDTVLGLSSIEVDDDGKYILVNELNPREFAEVADVDLDLVRLLYRFYAIDQEQYGAFMKKISVA